MQALKALVIVMGILILIAMGVIAATLYQRMSARFAGDEPAAEAGPAPPATAPAAVPRRPFGERRLGLPRGARIEDMTAEGDRLVLRLRLPDGGYRILVLDLADGSRLGALDLEPAP